ncbi:MAG: hypothetical protein AMS17_02700 [Spirochaetes bacterium DG_61]|jgi:Lrp/AsnC family transcriptional regulator for asnA, asnC and gidA|nr:MAG: hypothetical protein AMS17_02700 [Spirochaetes bacterium DG_61]
MKIDRIDLRIVEILAENGRIPNNEIAAKLTISEGTVRNRIRKLTENNFLRIKGLLNPDEGSGRQLIYILVTLVMTRNWKEIAQRVSELPHVKSVSMITGRFDLIVELFIEPHNLIGFLTEQLSTVGEIKSTESLLTIKNFKKWV